MLNDREMDYNSSKSMAIFTKDWYAPDQRRNLYLGWLRREVCLVVPPDTLALN